MLAMNDGRTMLRRVKDRDGRWTGELTVPGVEYGKLYFVNLNDRGHFDAKHVGHGVEHDDGEHFATIHEKGHGYWSGRGQPQAYAPATLHIVRLLSWDDDGFVVEPLYDFPAKATRHTTKGN